MFGNKPFLVYDIETVFDAKGSGQEFAIAYYVDSSTVTADQLPYQFVGKEDLA